MIRKGQYVFKQNDRIFWFKSCSNSYIDRLNVFTIFGRSNQNRSTNVYDDPPSFSLVMGKW